MWLTPFLIWRSRLMAAFVAEVWPDYTLFNGFNEWVFLNDLLRFCDKFLIPLEHWLLTCWYWVVVCIWGANTLCFWDGWPIIILVMGLPFLISVRGSGVLVSCNLDALSGFLSITGLNGFILLYRFCTDPWSPKPYLPLCCWSVFLLIISRRSLLE